MDYQCAWCGKEIEETAGEATMDTCEACEEFFDEHTENIAETLNKLLEDNEARQVKTAAEKKQAAWISYSLITAIHMVANEPVIEFKDSKFLKNL
ncbi:MAG: hypothetical protein HZC28_03320 [Spirochaetes bacterium]|nr:hypothetical protein [Spirochaetota bacterium]